MHHVFVDCENVHTVDPSVIGGPSVKFTLLVGAKQTRIRTDLVETLVVHSASVEFIRLTSSGHNALDLVLAYYLGRAVLSHPATTYHVVSKDKGYDALVEHLRHRRFAVMRHDDFNTLPFLKANSTTVRNESNPPPSSDDLLQRASDHLRKHPKSRPKRRKTLASHLLAWAGKSATSSEITALVEKLIKGGSISIGDKEAITYHLD